MILLLESAYQFSSIWGYNQSIEYCCNFSDKILNKALQESTVKLSNTSFYIFENPYLLFPPNS